MQMTQDCGNLSLIKTKKSVDEAKKRLKDVKLLPPVLFPAKLSVIWIGQKQIFKSFDEANTFITVKKTEWEGLMFLEKT